MCARVKFQALANSCTCLMIRGYWSEVRRYWEKGAAMTTQHTPIGEYSTIFKAKRVNVTFCFDLEQTKRIYNI